MPGFVAATALAMRLGVYDMAGYYDVCYIASDVKNPRSTVPKAVVLSAISISVVYGLVYVAVMGAFPWFGEDGFANKDSLAYQHLMSIFYENLFGKTVAFIFTSIVVLTIFGSAFAMLIGYVSIPWAAARDGYFLQWFAELHPTRAGLAHHSLLSFAAVTAMFCFVKLDLVIEGMLTMRLIVQFTAQAIAVLICRSRGLDSPWNSGLWKFAAYLSLPGYLFLFFSTKNYVISGEAPLLECSVIFMLGGLLAYLLWAAHSFLWPFGGGRAVHSGELSVPLASAEGDCDGPLLEKEAC